MLILAFLLGALGSAWAPLGDSPEPARLQVLHQDPTSVEVEFTLPALYGEPVQENGQTFLQISFHPSGFLTRVGEPQLPLYSRLVGLPGNTAAQVEILEAESQEVPLPYPVQPYQGVVYRSGEREYPEFQFRPEAYEQESYPPEGPVALGRVGILREVRVAPLIFYPVVYHPRRQTATVYTRLRVRVTFEGVGSNAFSRVPTTVSPSFLPLYRKLLLNAETVLRHRTLQEGSLLVIANDAYAEAAQAYARFKRDLGVPVVLRFTSEFNPLTAEVIKDYIQEAYDTWETPPEYVVLIGDAEDVPYFTEYSIPTDQPYAELAGDDFFPDIHYGRISVATAEQANYVVQSKVIRYTLAPDTSTLAWFTSGTGISGSDYVDDENAARCGLIASEYGHLTHWDSLYASLGTNTVNNILDALNQGRSWLAYFGHGSATSWVSTSPSFEISHVYSLTNGLRLPTIMDIACDNGAFVNGECFAEAWIRAGDTTNPKGALAIVAATVSSPFFYTDTLGRGFFLGYFRDSLWSVGAALTYGKMYMFQYFPEPDPGSTTHKTMLMHQVFGDPHIDPWSDVPRPLLVNHPASVHLGQSLVTVIVAREGVPVPYARVSFFQDTLLLASGFTDPFGQVNLNLEVTQANIPLTLRVVYHNSRMYESEIYVVSEGPYVNLQTFMVQDDNDGQPNPGETVALDVVAKNWGSDTAYGVFARLTSQSPDLFHVLTDSVFLGHLNPGDSLYVPNAFQIRVDSSAVDRQMGTLAFAFYSSEGDTWTTQRGLMVAAPVLHLAEYTLVDPNGEVVDPGDTALLVFTAWNSGHADAPAVNADLQLTDTLMTPLVTTTTLGDLAPGDTSAPETLRFYVSPETPLRYVVTFGVELTTGFQVFADSGETMIGVGGDFLVLDLDPTPLTGPLLHTFLADTLNLTGLYTTTYSPDLLAEMPYYKAIFVLLGIYSNNYRIEETDPLAQALVSYLVDDHGNLYMEGGDVWYYDPSVGGFDFAPYFGIQPLEDGSSDLGTVLGVPGSFAEGMSFTYTGENNWIDRLEATQGAVNLLENASPSYYCGVAYDNTEADYKTVGLSLELGGLQAQSTEVSTLIRAILNFFGVITEVQEAGPVAQLRFALAPPRPNPAPGQATLAFALPQPGRVDLEVYDAAGRRIAVLIHGTLPAGVHQVTWNGQDAAGRPVASGVYFVRLRQGRQEATRKLLLLR